MRHEQARRTEARHRPGVDQWQAGLHRQALRRRLQPGHRAGHQARGIRRCLHGGFGGQGGGRRAAGLARYAAAAPSACHAGISGPSEENQKALAAIVTEEHGKTLPDAIGSVQRGIEVVEFACGIPHLLKGEYAENAGTQVDTHTVRQPVGVCAGITPFNFPVMVPLWMFPMAIACGNSFILKPSEKVPSASLRMAELFQEAGLPDGVLNVLHGDKESVDAILGHPGIQAVSFVGSTPIAKYIYETCARHGKRVQALGGAKNHAVVLPDADLEFAADALIGAAYGSAGERCMAVSAVVAVGAAGDPLVRLLEKKARKIKVGPGDKEGIDMGPLVTEAHRDKVKSFVDKGVSEGAKLVVDG